MAVCHRACQPPCCYGCELRQKNVGIAPSALPTQHNKVAPRPSNPVWEKGIISDSRPGGFEVPYLEPGTNTPLHVKQYAENKREIDRRIKAVRTGVL